MADDRQGEVTTAPTKPPEFLSISDLASSQPPLDPVHQAIVDERKAERGLNSKRPTRDALVALQYNKIKHLQPHVFARLEKAVLNEEDPLHEMVIEKLMMRVVPVAFWESLGKQEFAVDDKSKAMPSVTIVINGDAGKAPAIDIVSEQ